MSFKIFKKVYRDIVLDNLYVTNKLTLPIINFNSTPPPAIPNINGITVFESSTQQIYSSHNGIWVPFVCSC
jgi:hypothetical protein